MSENRQHSPRWTERGDLHDLSALFDSGTLLHPLPEHIPSFLDLVRHVARVCGVESLPPPRALEERISGFVGNPRHLVFVLVEGMGLNVRDHFPRSGFLERNLQCRMRALFPSTAAAEETGLSITDLVRHAPITDAITRTSAMFVPHPIRNGTFSRWFRGNSSLHTYNTFEDIPPLIWNHVAASEMQSYSYLYITDVDATSHTYGYRSMEVEQTVSAVDRILLQLEETLPQDARIVVAADHGQVIVPDGNHFVLTAGHPVARYLECPPSGEGRSPVFHVKPGHEERFRHAFDSSGFGPYFRLVSPEEAEELKLFGPEALGYEMKERLGTWIAIAVEPVLIDWVFPETDPLPLRGAHGGLRPEEMALGLFVND